jgi:hypothetical protein
MNSATNELHISAPNADGISDLSAGIKELFLDEELHRIRSALSVLAHAGAFNKQQGRLEMLLGPLTCEARRQPDLLSPLKELYCDICLASVDVAQTAGYDTSDLVKDSDDQWDKNLKLDSKIPNTWGAVFAAARATGWIEPDTLLGSVPFADFTVQPNVAPVVPFGQPAYPSQRKITRSDKPLPRRPVLGHRFYEGEYTILGGPGGLGKTAIAVSWGLSVASGIALLYDQPIGGPHRVAFISTEDGGDEMHRRILAAAEHFNLGDDVLDRITFSGTDDGRLNLITKIGNNAAVHQGGIAALRQLILDHGIKLLVLDPLTTMVPDGLNETGLMAQLAGELKRVAKETGAAIALLHHFKKGGDGSVEDISGAAAIVNHARVAITLRNMTEAEAKSFPNVMPSDLWRFIRPTNAKMNYAPRGLEADFIELRSHDLANPQPPFFSDKIQVAVPFVATAQVGGPVATKDQKIIEDQIVANVAAAAVPPYLNKQGRGGNAETIYDQIADIVEATTKRTGRDATKIGKVIYEDLCRRDVLREEQVPGKNRHPRMGVVLGEAAPEVEATR